jgi:hypothetical protein
MTDTPDSPAPPPADRPSHRTIPVEVWADVDEGIAPFVRLLNTIDGVRTHSACQGSIGEGGAMPYPAFVTVSWWTERARERLLELGLIEDGKAHGTVYPRPEFLARRRVAPPPAGGAVERARHIIDSLCGLTGEPDEVVAQASLLEADIAAALTATASDARARTVAECVQIVAGQPYKERYRTWPEVGGDIAANNSNLVLHCDALAKAIQSLADAPAPRSEWRPIESAPKDGQPILAISVAQGNTVRIVRFDTQSKQWNSIPNSLWRLRATHWMPLPAPPLPEGEKP